MRYPDFPANATELEENVLARWRAEHLFERTLEQTTGGEPFVFFEGPPTANGRPGIHHVISRTIKDLICRHRTMRGRHVTRIAGWDTHGLPVEIEAERRLGISGKREIEALGIDRFNEACRESVFTYKEDWQRLSERIGYWLDYSSAYVTFKPDYIESVWHIFSQFSDRGLLYRGHRSVPYCPRCGTALSSHEVAQGYEDVADPSIYTVFDWLDANGEADAGRRAFLVWTTTPWTLPSNIALAVDAGLSYVEVEHDGRRLVLAESRVAALFGDAATIVGRHTGRDLVGQRYQPPFDWFAADNGAERAWRVYAEDFVTADDGTGIVHLAPAFGADDFAAGQRHQLPMFTPVDDAGRFRADVPLVAGEFVKDADALIVEDLRRRSLVFRYSVETHTYPHCGRCGSPLLYMARDSWYLRTTAAREAMLENNRQVRWHPPEIGTGRFGEWLEGNVDWAISRERYWGTPLPIWVCDRSASHVEVIGSFAALAERAGALPPDFDPHKPHIDTYQWPCAACAGTMRRTPEVADVWFDSGAMPWAQWHYPFENEDRFRRHFPADFICEGVDQTRGWFYSLMAIATMLDAGPAYRNVVVNDLLLDAEGQKMSKSRGNVVDPWTAIDNFGADAIRWYLLTVSVPWVPKRFDPAALADAARRTFDTLANTYRFFALYAGLEGWHPSDNDPAVAERATTDRWVMSRLAGLVERVDTDLDAYEITRAARAIGDFVINDLSNWYVRRSRDRFWASIDAADTRAAFRTLHDTLVTVARLFAPFVPFHADWLHRALTSGSSAHLAAFPAAQLLAADRDERLEEGMDDVRELARLGRAARERVRIRVRQPLARLQAVLPARRQLPPELLAILKDELNVKQIEFLDAAEALVQLRPQPNFRGLGRRFGKRTPAVADALRALPQAELAAFRDRGELKLEVDGELIRIDAEEFAVHEEAGGELLVETGAGFTVALDATVDEALRIEGLARELVNRIQRLRRDTGLHVSDRISIGLYSTAAAVVEAARRHQNYIAAETLAVSIEIGTTAPAAAGGHPVDLDGMPVEITVARAAQ
jgi:isoleucyl-tRNA synthetase